MRNSSYSVLVSAVLMALMFALAPSLQAPLIAHATHASKPLKVWTVRASWYGPTFQGHLTANGELYDMAGLTAAHPTLPFGSMVRLTNLRSGKTAVVRINDRGPYVDGRDIDLSYHAADKLGIIGSGVAKVRMELIEEPKRP
jgi:rare lipoprotein A